MTPIIVAVITGAFTLIAALIGRTRSADERRGDGTGHGRGAWTGYIVVGSAALTAGLVIGAVFRGDGSGRGASHGRTRTVTQVTTVTTSRTGASGTNKTTGTNPTSANGSVRRASSSQYPVSIANGSEIDLDSERGDWGETTGDSSYNADLSYGIEGGYYFAGENGATLAPVQRAPTYLACLNATGYSDSYVFSFARSRGMHLCVRTSNGRRAGLTVKRASETGVTFASVVVWNKS